MLAVTAGGSAGLGFVGLPVNRPVSSSPVRYFHKSIIISEPTSFARAAQGKRKQPAIAMTIAGNVTSKRGNILFIFMAPYAQPANMQAQYFLMSGGLRTMSGRFPVLLKSRSCSSLHPLTHLCKELIGCVNSDEPQPRVLQIKDHIHRDRQDSSEDQHVHPAFAVRPCCTRPAVRSAKP